MTTVEQATQTILSNPLSFGVELVSLQGANGRILKEDLVADRDFPPFNRVSMDGIAFCFDHFNTGQRHFTIEGLQAAGAEQMSLENKKNCLEVMTGAVLPKGVNTVVRYEDVVIKGGEAIVQVDVVKLQQNIHQKGTDRLAGALLVKRGCRITPAEIGVAATCLLYTSPSPRDRTRSRMPSSA